MKNNKLSIEKFRILEMTNLSNVHGGTGGHGGSADMSTYAESSETTTYTTDSEIPCPGDTDATGTADTNNGNVTIPTLLIL